jgi:hypothetical protein
MSNPATNQDTSIVSHINKCLTLFQLKKPQSDHNELVQIVSVKIPRYFIQSSLVLYEVCVETNYKVTVDNKETNLVYSVTRRYNEFYELNQYLSGHLLELSGLHNNHDSRAKALDLAPFPSRAIWLWQDHFNENFLEQRLVLLENYLQKCLKSKIWRRNPYFLQILSPNSEDSLVSETRKHGTIQDKPEAKASYDDVSTTTSFGYDKKEYSQFLNAALHNPNKAHQDHLPNSPLSQFAASNSSLPTSNSFTLRKFPSVSHEITFLSIPTAQILRNQHIVYHVCCENESAPAEYAKWTVLKRYSEFVALDQTIRAELGKPNQTTNDRNQTITIHSNAVDLMPLLPPKEPKFLVDHLHTTFIEERRILLELYIRKLLADIVLCESESLLKFLGCSVE